MAVPTLFSQTPTSMSLTLAIIFLFLVAGLAQDNSHSLPFPVRTVYEFPVGTFVENLAVRSNGQILVTIITSPDLLLLNSNQTGPPTVVHSFDGYESLTGIVEYEEDVFAVITGNFTLATVDFTPSTWAVWRVNMTNVQQQADGTLSPAPSVSKITDVQNVMLNGMSLLSQSDGTVLLGDFVGGQIFRLNVNTGSLQLVIANVFTAPASLGILGFPPFGVDGLRVRDGSVYIVNVGKEIFVRQPINEDGTPRGNGVILAHARWQFDDFNFDSEGNAYVATGSGNSILRVSPDGTVQEIVAGDATSTLIAEPTSAAFGRGKGDRNTLYVTTAGGLFAPINESIIVGGQVLAITTNAVGASPLFESSSVGDGFLLPFSSPELSSDGLVGDCCGPSALEDHFPLGTPHE